MAIRTLSSLREHLQLALQLEHSTIPPYLCALYSIRTGHNREAAALLQSIAVDEMLHLAMVANLLNAVGGQPDLLSPGFIPQYPDYLTYSGKAFQLLSLEKFSKRAIQAFMRLELTTRGPAREDDPVLTVGHFYGLIREGFEFLSGQLGERDVFVGDPDRQVSPETWSGPRRGLIRVTDLESAMRAIDEIAEQGEGFLYGESEQGRGMFAEGRDYPHYFRLKEIYHERHYAPDDTPGSEPTGRPLPIDWSAVYNMRPNPKAMDYPEGSIVRQALTDFAETYAELLETVQDSFSGASRYLLGLLEQMADLKAQAIVLMRMPSGDDETTVGPGFECRSPVLVGRAIASSRGRSSIRRPHPASPSQPTVP